MITIKTSGSWHETQNSLQRMTRDQIWNVLEAAGQVGVDALSNATPVRSGLTAESWYYQITKSFGKHSIIFHNSNVHDGEIIAILIQYGHGTRNGGYVEGRDFINPAIQPIFDDLANTVWKEVTSS